MNSRHVACVLLLTASLVSACDGSEDPDAGALDAASDAGPTDAGPMDSGPADSGPADAGPADSGPAGCDALDCGSNGSCVEDPDARCACEDGWTGAACDEDVDECEDETDDCDVNATCTNTDGAFTCACDAGYEGDGTTCAATCAVVTCMNGGTCADTTLPATCDCAATGYTGAFCETNVDECADGLDDCDADATCTDTDGMWTCACNAPLVGDGRACACPSPTAGPGCLDCIAGYHPLTSGGCALARSLTITIEGDGVGVVTVEGDAMECRDTCVVTVADGDVLTVTATAGATTSAPVWSGACSGATCEVTISGDTEVGLSWQLEHNIVFATSTAQVVGSIGSVANADATCASLASDAGLHPTSWVAFLASAAACPGEGAGPCDPFTRLAGARGWVNARGEPVFDTLAQLRDTDLFQPIRYDENGDAAFDFEVVTGINVLLDLASTCSDYTDSSADSRAHFGRAGSSTINAISQSGNMRCNSSVHLYCFSTDHDTELVPEPQTGRLAFISSAPFLPADGLAAADALCQRDACDAGLTGSGDCGSDPGSARTFRAFLQTAAVPAGGRFDASGADYVRPDGIPFLSVAQLGVPTPMIRPASALLRLADGTRVTSAPRVWTGAGGDTCADWTTDAANGNAAITDNVYFSVNGSARACTTEVYRVYCLEE